MSITSVFATTIYDEQFRQQTAVYFSDVMINAKPVKRIEEFYNQLCGQDDSA